MREGRAAGARRRGGLLAATVSAAALLAAAAAPAETADPVLEEIAQAFAPGLQTSHKAFSFDGRPVPLLALSDADDRPAGFVFRTRPLVTGIEGYGGPIDLGVAVAPDGELLGAMILESRETPFFERPVHAWLPSLAGRRIYDEPDILEADAVTGATLTSEAVLRTLHAAGRVFATEALGRPATPGTPRPRTRPEAFALAFALCAAAALRFRPSRRLRQAWLLAVFLGFGVFWNVQVSLGTTIRLARFELPAAAFTATFLLVVAVPLLVLLFGNLYCGWLCPYGAIQELVGDARRGRFALDPERRTWSRMRRARYALLLALLGWALFSGGDTPAEADPLAYAFAQERAAPLFLFAAALLLPAVGFGRFWCRNLCPAGAALALLGRLSPLRRRWPRVRPGRCDYGVASAGDLDCLLCDRCRQPDAAPPRGALSPRSRARLLAGIVALALALWVLAARAALAAAGT